MFDLFLPRRKISVESFRGKHQINEIKGEGVGGGCKLVTQFDIQELRKAFADIPSSHVFLHLTQRNTSINHSVRESRDLFFHNFFHALRH